MTAIVHLRLPDAAGRTIVGRRLALAIGGTLALATIAAGWPSLVAEPVIGGPLVALAVGAIGWATASPAPRAPACANDNAPRAGSPLPRRHARQAGQAPGATAMMGGKRAEQRGTGGLSVIGAEVTVTGNIATRGDLHVDGTVEGDISCGSLVQGASGRIVGTVTATTARLAGTIEGRVAATTLIVEKAAKLRGDAEYQTLQIETGAQVDGRMTHRTADARSGEAPLRLVDASDAAG